MAYFKNLKEKWAITLLENQELEDMQKFIKRVRETPYTGKQVVIELQYRKEVSLANQFERKIIQIEAQIRQRRWGAIIGK